MLQISICSHAVQHDSAETCNSFNSGRIAIALSIKLILMLRCHFRPGHHTNDPHPDLISRLQDLSRILRQTQQAQNEKQAHTADAAEAGTVALAGVLVLCRTAFCNSSR